MLVNSVVDLAAERALVKPVNKRMAVPYSDFKILTNMYRKKMWQTEWERYQKNNLYKIQPKVDDPIPSHGRGKCIMPTAYWSHFFKLIFIY